MSMGEQAELAVLAGMDYDPRDGDYSDFTFKRKPKMSTATVRAPRLAQSGPAATVSKGFSLADIASTSKPLPSRWGLHATNGFGKTSLTAYAPSPIFIETKGETGLETLISAGQLPPTPHFPEIENWPDLLAAIKALRNEEHSYKSLVIDTANGCERMCHEYVCSRDFNGDWGERGFASYQKGYDVALADWRMFLNELDKLRIEKMMTIFMLVHTRIKTFRNPAGADFDKYSPELNDKTWSLTKGWLDNLLFGNFEVTVTDGTRVANSNKKGKAAELSQRMLYTSSDNPVFDAKNRLGLPPEIEMGSSPAEGWLNLTNAIKAARKQEANG